MKLLRAQWDRAAALFLATAGLLALLLGWLGVSRAVYPAEQLPYIISGGLTGLVLVGMAATLWLSADLRDEWRHLDRLEDRVQARVEELVREELAKAAPPSRARRQRAGVANGSAASVNRDQG